MNVKKWLTDLVCGLFIVLFLYTALSKLLDYEKFRVQLGQSPLLTNFAGFAAWAVPAAEIVLVLLLVIPKMRLTGLYGSFALMVMFTGYIVAILNFSDYVPCSCGGIVSQLSWSEHLVFNIAFTAFAAIGVSTYPKSPENTSTT